MQTIKISGFTNDVVLEIAAKSNPLQKYRAFAT